jgi:hypothetical protein
MFSAAFLNSSSLFPHFAGWMKDSPHEDLSVYLSRATAGLIHVRRLRELRARCLEEFHQRRDDLTLTSGHLSFWSPTVAELAGEVSPALGSLRMMQNMILPMVARVSSPRVSVPSSMASAIKKLSSYGLPRRIEVLTQEYWQRGGRELKDFRDMDQHFDLICTSLLHRTRSHAYVGTSSAG